MRRRSPPRIDESIVRVPPPAEVYLSPEQLAAACGLSPVRLDRLVRLGVIEPDATGVPRFSVTAAVRLRKILRLRADLGVNLAAAEIIVDLLARLDRLENELTRACGHTGP